MQLLDPEAGDQTFSVGLTTAFGGPITHYWCGISLKEEDLLAIQQAVDEDPELTGSSLFDENATPSSVLAQLDLHRLPESLDS